MVGGWVERWLEGNLKKKRKNLFGRGRVEWEGFKGRIKKGA